MDDLLRILRSEFYVKEGVLYSKTRGAVGTPHERGYLTAMIAGHQTYVHRWIWLYYHGHWPVYGIDHIDRDPTNNRIENLRDVPQAINTCNRAGWSKTGLPKHIYKQAAGFRVWGKRLGKTISGGTHKTLEQAIAARNAIYAENGWTPVD